jgi:hydrogenase maturation protease
MPVDTLFVGIGSDHGDDRVGWLVTDELKRRETRRVILRHAKAPLDLLDWLEGIRCLAVCDACVGSGPIGSWCRWKWPHHDIPFVSATGSHGLGLQDALQLAARLEILPRDVQLWGIEIAGDQPSDQLTPEVAASIDPVASDVMSVLRLRQMA